MDVKILHGYRYIGPRHAVQMIRRVPRVCSTQSYLECVLAWNEVTHVCKKFSEVMHSPEIMEPDVFMRFFADEDDYGESAIHR